MASQGLHVSLIFNPLSTSRRNASERDGLSDWRLAQASTSLLSAGGNRTGTVGQQAWAQLYQFGHELGHVLANSWQPHAQPTNPCQWLEEAMVEAFSLRGLGRLAVRLRELLRVAREA